MLQPTDSPLVRCFLSTEIVIDALKGILERINSIAEIFRRKLDASTSAHLP